MIFDNEDAQKYYNKSLNLEKALDMACKWIHDWAIEYDLSPFGSPETFKNFFLDEEFHTKFEEMLNNDKL